MMFSDRDAYLRYAKECRKMAAAVRSADRRAAWLALADEWALLARHGYVQGMETPPYFNGGPEPSQIPHGRRSA